MLKAARDHARSGRLVEEASSLRALPPDPEVVHLLEGPLELGGRTCLLVELAGEHTLARELAAGERLSLDRLRRWGDDLIDLLALLERAGVFHRDLKPANLGVRNRADGQPHLVLFDFSLASAGVDDLAAGTPGYRDPFLAARGAYDAAAEAWSAATVLHEMATGARPTLVETGGDADTGAESVVLRLSAFDPAVAEGLRDFFATALDAEVGQRFDNAEQMREAWQQVFADAERREQQVSPEQLAAAASLSTPLRQSGLSDRAVSAVEQFGAATVEDLLEVPAFELSRATGASQATKDEVVARWRQWRRDLRSDVGVTGASVDALLADLAPEGEDLEARAVRLLLGQRDETAGVSPLAWPTPRSVADELDMDRAAVMTAWQRFLHELEEGGALGEVRGLVLEVLAALDGVATASEVATRVVDRRGSHSDGDDRVAAGQAVVRVAVEQPVHHGVPV